MKRFSFYLIIVCSVIIVLFTAAEAAPLSQIQQIVESHAVEPVDGTVLPQKTLAEIGSFINDPYFTYFPPDVLKQYLDTHQGYYGGIGTQIVIHEERLLIWTVHKNTPASAAGLRFMDEIIAVDGNTVDGLSVQEVAMLLRGIPGSEVTVTLLRDGKTFSVTMTRVIIQIPSVLGSMRDGVAVIELNNFNANAPRDFRVVLRELRLQLPHGLIVDLRGNPGGALSSVLEIAQELVPEGPVVRLQGRQGSETVLVSRQDPAPFPFLVILVDGETASAAEILAGAVQDRGAGLVVGNNSFGKGTVQSVFRLSDNGGLRLTTARFFTPSGKAIEKAGIVPDIEIYDWHAQLGYAVSLVKHNAGQQLTFTIGRTNVWVAKNIVEADYPPFIQDGRSYIPLRLLAESMGYLVEWDEPSFTATLRQGETELRIPLRENIVYLNGKAISLEAPVEIRADRAYLPVRTIAETLGSQVYWNHDARQVTVSW
ncbi:MAG: S41 family peptidase [Bacillota bacterium]|nr:S41 family peptidase [Bacillota bacterium]MDW7685200.1 S41 family peptidase [Bacillota bacterium]